MSNDEALAAAPGVDKLRRPIVAGAGRPERFAIRNNTPAALAAQHPQSPPVYSQPEKRRRRRGQLPTDYGGDWSLRREIAEVVGPLADRVAAAPRPTRFRLPVRWLAEDVHELASTIKGWVAEVDARARTEHLADEPGKRRFAMTTLVDLAPRPAAVEITDKMLADGSWAAALVEMVSPLDAGLADLLARAFPPGAPALRGQLSRSDRLNELLRDTLDLPAAELVRRLDRADREQSSPAAVAKAEQAKADLAALGIEV